MFRTTFDINKPDFSISLRDKILLLGSCFAEHAGKYLHDNKFKSLSNPFGTLFNPISITDLLCLAGDWRRDNVEREGVWLNYRFHSEVFGYNEQELERRVLENLANLNTFEPDVVLLTLGTAWVYRHKETGLLVANCHKMPARSFEKVLLKPEEISGALCGSPYLLGRKVILTVSPVRHIKDSLPLNSISKGVLRLACHYACEEMGNFEYFPAYELINDDLRDYRFFEADMIHPNQQAVRYVLDHFGKSYFDGATLAFLQKWEKIRLRLSHRPLHERTKGTELLLQNLLKDLGEISAVDVGDEIAEVQGRLAILLGN